MTYRRSEFAQENNISHDILTDFDRWLELLIRWNTRINLVSKAAMDEFWLRHALDSWQVWNALPAHTESVLDLGSGGGFPGLALAIGAKHRGGIHITMTESAGKKANFLRTVIRELSLPATVHAGRIEDMPPEHYTIITARAFAPLPKLLTYARGFWGPGTKAILLKGQNAEAEINDAHRQWTFDHISQISRSDPAARILTISSLSPNS